jgi:hypothetical protein
VIQPEDEGSTTFSMWAEPGDDHDPNKSYVSISTPNIRADELAGHMLEVSNAGKDDVTFRIVPWEEEE